MTLLSSAGRGITNINSVFNANSRERPEKTAAALHLRNASKHSPISHNGLAYHANCPARNPIQPNTRIRNPYQTGSLFCDISKHGVAHANTNSKRLMPITVCWRVVARNELFVISETDVR